ncbi:MAG: hypothetical protein PQJ59_08005 [Spirochaetales bacterium]|nr:hypothetical protein [Spirochaetales bacterium]
MKQYLILLTFLAGVSLFADGNRNWRDLSLQENLILEDYVPQENTVLVAAKISSNRNMKDYVLDHKMTNEAVYERLDMNALVCLLLDLTGSSKGREVKALYFSWDEYFIMEVPVGDYKFHSMIYPPYTKNSMFSFNFNDMMDYHFSMDSPFVYIGDINLLFDVKNDFGFMENRLEIVDNFAEAESALAHRIKDESGAYVEFTKSLPPVMKSIVFDISDIK